MATKVLIMLDQDVSEDHDDDGGDKDEEDDDVD